MAVDKKKHGKNPAKSSKPEGNGKKFSGKRDFGKNSNKNVPRSIKDFMKKGDKDKKHSSADNKKKDFKKKSFGDNNNKNKKPFTKKPFEKKPFAKKDFKKDNGEAKKDLPKKRKDFDGKDKDGKQGADKEKRGKKDFSKKPRAASGDAKKAKASDPASYRAKKPYFKLVETIKGSWNKVRDHSTAAEARANLVADMVKNIKTHVLDVTLRHDASRMVQTILQFGNDAQREIVLKELQEKMFEIAKTPYGHFAVLKAITYCTEQSAMKKIVSSLQKHFVSLGTHVIGARTVESILQLYPVALTRSLKAEFYGKNFSILLPETPKSLRDVIEQLPAKRISALDHMRDLIAKLAQKQLLEFTYVHHLLYEYTQELQLLFDEATTGAGKAEGKEGKEKHQQLIDDLVNQLADSAPKLLSTKPGAKAMCFVITHAPAKDRKRIIKSLKGHCLESLLHDSAFLGVMRLVDLTDDTVNVQKSFFDELKANEQTIKYTATGEVSSKHEAPWLAIAKHPNASKLLLRLLTPQKRHLEPDEEVLFQTASVHSKKDPALRRKEHVTFLRQVLLKVLSPHVEELLRSRSGSRVLEALVEVYHPRDLVQNIALAFAGQEVVVAEPEEEEEEEEDEEEEEFDEEEGDEEDMGVMDDEFDGEEEEGEGEDDEEGDDEEEEGEGEEDDEEEEEEGDAEGDEEYEEQLEEAKQDLKEAANKQKKGKAEAAPAAPVLPIEEDPVAHIVLKRLLRWESFLETQENAPAVQESIRVLQEYEKQREHKEKDNGVAGPIDKSLWVENSEEDGSVSLAQSLWEQLSADEYALLRKWVSCNRPSFALHELLRVPSIFAHIEKLFADLSEELSDAALEKHEGGKTLKRLHAAFVASKEVKTKVTKKEESQDKKKKTSKKK